ncbi:MAG: methylmalonyl-CoA decarboxylase subunit alpha [Actinomycetota bacterium]|jgi:acetyl-CoA carboxylase carboxyltransferase component|nr:methylmalonyl-CoA decarboxylase subunit alpha [Actinomycetota bacterium]
MTEPSQRNQDLAEVASRVKQGGAPKYHEKLAQQGKLFVRDRLELLLDSADGFVEDGLLVNALAGDLPADGVVTGVGQVGGRPVAVMANDPTVKAGSWGARTVEKIIRIIELARKHEHPIVYLVDSAGARITDQIDLFPGRRGAGKIFYNQVQASGHIPQVCCLFGPSAAGGAYIPAFCDVVFMVEGNASMYLGSPRMAEEVIGEKVTLEEMGGARMHCEVSGVGDMVVTDDKAAIEAAKGYLSYFGQSWRDDPPQVEARGPAYTGSLATLVPEDESQAFDMYSFIAGVIDDGSFFEIKPDFAKELITGIARIEGRAVGILANQPAQKGGVLFVDSADKAARFIWLCDAFNIPLVFLSDVPGFMIGTQVERQGIIRHGAKMITAVSEATVPKFCVVVRKAYGAGLYAMAGPGFEPDATIALPTARIAVMGPEPAVNAVYFNKIQAIEDLAERERFVAEKRAEYESDIDLVHLASENIIDAVVQPDDLRADLLRRLIAAERKDRHFSDRRHGVPPV